MFMFLSILFASLVVVGLCGAILAAREPREAPQPEMKLAVEPPRFFADVAVSPQGPSIPVELLLSYIERHVRLEQAAAERFVNVPSTEALRTPTASPFVN